MSPDPTPFPLDHLSQRGAPDAPALTVGEVTLSFAELDDAVGRNAAVLLRQGLAPGDRVASWMGKTMLACVLPLAAARAGLVHVPINPLLKRAQVAHILADSGARLLVANAARLASLEPGDRAEATLARESFERAVSVAASVADFMARQEYLVDLFAAGPNLYHLTAGRSLAYLDQILVHGFVHADPHPGNVLITDDGLSAEAREQLDERVGELIVVTP